MDTPTPPSMKKGADGSIRRLKALLDDVLGFEKEDVLGDADSPNPGRLYNLFWCRFTLFVNHIWETPKFKRQLAARLKVVMSIGENPEFCRRLHDVQVVFAKGIKALKALAEVVPPGHADYMVFKPESLGRYCRMLQSETSLESVRGRIREDLIDNCLSEHLFGGLHPACHVDFMSSIQLEQLLGMLVCGCTKLSEEELRGLRSESGEAERDSPEGLGPYWEACLRKFEGSLAPEGKGRFHAVVESVGNLRKASSSLNSWVELSLLQPNQADDALRLSVLYAGWGHGRGYYAEEMIGKRGTEYMSSRAIARHRGMGGKFDHVAGEMAYTVACHSAKAVYRMLSEHAERGAGEEVEKPEACKHSEDFTKVIWYGQEYPFNKSQARAVKALWGEWEKGTNGLAQETVGEGVGYSGGGNFRLIHLFRRGARGRGKRGGQERKAGYHPAWGRMIVSVGKGIFGLSKPKS